MTTRKILYSPGYGAGWTTWNRENRDVQMLMLTYAPIVAFLEAGNCFTYEESETKWSEDEETLESEASLHPLLRQLRAEARAIDLTSRVYVGGAHQLRVAIVSGRVKIDEYDGSESFIVEGDFSEWL